MRFDCTPYYHVGEQYSWDTLMDEMHQEVKLIDQGGFTGLWLAEHHFAWDGWYRASPNPILLRRWPHQEQRPPQNRPVRHHSPRLASLTRRRGHCPAG